MQVEGRWRCSATGLSVKGMLKKISIFCTHSVPNTASGEGRMAQGHCDPHGNDRAGRDLWRWSPNPCQDKVTRAGDTGAGPGGLGMSPEREIAQLSILL